MTQAPAHIAADVLVIGAGGAGMYAALAAAEAGAGRIVLADRNMVGRGGATVMAQMTVAAALGEAEPDSVEDHLEDTLEAGRGLCDPGLATLLCEEGPVRIREMDSWKVGWAREGGRIAQVTAPGHRRRRCCYVDILNTGPAVAATLRRRVARADAIRRLSGLVVTDPVMADGRLAGAVGFDMETGRAVHAGGTGDGGRDRRADGALHALQRVGQHGGRGPCLRACRRCCADRHGVRAVLPHRPSLPAPRRHGPDHVGPVPLQAGRAAAEWGDERVPAALRWQRRGALHGHPRLGHPCHLARGPGRAGLAPRRRLPLVRPCRRGRAARCLRAGDRPLGRERHRPDRCAGGGRADRPLPHGRHRGGHAARDTRARALRRRRGRGRRQWREPPFRQRLTEAFVFGHRAGRNAALEAVRTPDAWRASAARPALDTLAERKEARGEGPSALSLSHELRQLMWEQVGPLRDGAGLDAAVERIRRMRREALSGLAVPACGAYDTGLADWYTLRASLEVAEAIAASAAARRESRGAHQREDFPESDAQLAMSQQVTRAGGVLAPAFPAAA